MIQTLVIDGKHVKFKASAAIPRIYRMKFGRDIFKDLSALESSVSSSEAKQSSLDIESLEVFENIAYVMAKHADSSVSEDPTEWLDQFETFSIYQILPNLIQLWGLNLKGQAVPRKKHDKPRGK